MLLAAKSTHDGFPVPHRSHSSCLATNVKSFEQPYHRGPVWSGKNMFHMKFGELDGSLLYVLLRSGSREKGREGVWDSPLKSVKLGIPGSI